MSKKIKQIIKYVGYIIFGGVLWGLFMYLVYTWLVGSSLLLAYLVNLTLIVVALAADVYTLKMLEKSMHSKERLKEMGKSGFVKFYFDAFISFKAILYLFYIAIMIFSQIIVYYPTLTPDSLGSFIVANEYSILILIAIDLFSGQFSRDKQKRKELSEKLERLLTEKEDERQ